MGPVGTTLMGEGKVVESTVETTNGQVHLDHPWDCPIVYSYSNSQAWLLMEEEFKSILEVIKIQYAPHPIPWLLPNLTINQ